MSLHYPFQQPPGQGEVVDITPDVKWLRSPLPLSLNHINCYLLRDNSPQGSGWCVLDTGMNGDEARQQWLDVIEGQLNGEPITRVIVTHHHPDHVGLAGWLCDHHRVSLYMTEAEYFYTRTLNSDTQQEHYWEAAQYFDRTGISKDDRNALLVNKHYNHLVSSVPTCFRRVKDGDTLTIGAHQWEAITTRGHSPEHLSLYCRELDILISGDQVLPEITSNVSVTPTQSTDNPLQDWIAAHTKIEQRVPDSVLILPAHQLPFKGLHQRLRAVVAHHEERLDAILALLTEPKSAQQITRELFDKSLESFQNFLAVGEVVAHLHYLLEQGRAKRELIGHMYYYEPSHNNTEGSV